MVEALIVAISATLIIVHSRIFENIRNFMYKKNEMIGYFFSCPMCLGFWIGAAFSIVYGNIIFLSFATSLLSWIVYNSIISLSQIGDFYSEK